MLSSKFTMLAVAALLSSASTALPLMPLLSSVDGTKTLVERGFNGMGLVTLILAVRAYLTDKNAYDSEVPGKCVLYMETTQGAHCRVNVQCAQSEGMGDWLPDWNVCYLNGRQFLTHPQVGDFSITFTQAGGVNSDVDGLHTPVIQFADLNNWEKFDVQNSIDTWTEPHGNLCEEGRSIPGELPGLNWRCGIPQIGQAAYGLSNYYPPSTVPGYTKGWCTMHVVQYQRNEYGIGADYAFDVVIFDAAKDAAKKEVGSTQIAPIDAKTKALNVDSQLPYGVVIIAAGGDGDAVTFKYGDQTWKSGDGSHQSTFGNGPDWGYENGNRKGDMGFNC